MNLFKNVILILSLATSCHSQELSLNNIAKIDSLTSHWKGLETPGGAIGIIQGDKLIYVNVQGFASLQQKMKMTPQTSFQLAQLSDSFIAYALLQLHYKGKVSLNKSVKDYLPELSNFPSSLKLIHLLQQASGIHDFEILKNISGWSDEKPFSLDNALSMIKNQSQLSFKPGSQFSYSRSNMLIISKLISKVTGNTFEEYMDTNVFRRLGLKNTFVLTTKNQNTNQLARSYQTSDDGSFMSIRSRSETYASANIVSSIEDMASWQIHLSAPKDKLSKMVVDHFNSFVVLKNGASYKVPRGRLTYGQRYVHKERGLDTEMSTGGIEGFASAIFFFPSERLSIVTLSNNGEAYNGYIGMLSAHEILQGAFPEPSSIDFNAISIQELDRNHIKKYEGSYWDALGEISREIRVDQDTLRYIRSNGLSEALVPLNKNVYQMLTEFDDKIILRFYENNGNLYMDYEYGEATPIPFVRYSKSDSFDKKKVPLYTGNYFCKELGSSFTVSHSEGEFLLNKDKLNQMKLIYIKDQIFAGDQWYMGSIEFKVDEYNRVLGFYVKNDAIRNLWFEKRN